MSKGTVAEFWEAMGTNDFTHASKWLDPEFEYYMPQTGEYLRGRHAFAALNAAYPTKGSWSFDVRSLVGDGDEIVSDVGVTDGTLQARAITFHLVRNALILKQVEYWPLPTRLPHGDRSGFRSLGPTRSEIALRTCVIVPFGS